MMIDQLLSLFICALEHVCFVFMWLVTLRLLYSLIAIVLMKSLRVDAFTVRQVHACACIVVISIVCHLFDSYHSISRTTTSYTSPLCHVPLITAMCSHDHLTSAEVLWRLNPVYVLLSLIAQLFTLIAKCAGKHELLFRLIR